MLKRKSENWLAKHGEIRRRRQVSKARASGVGKSGRSYVQQDSPAKPGLKLGAVTAAVLHRECSCCSR